ncbi:MAG TPA: hypothetical protein IAC19_00160 [Candidatus Ventricola gallistercoris]|nr:hypothetical protein [Candidatus Ventricola gallistercoris]
MTRQQVLCHLIRAQQASLLEQDGPTSLFIAPEKGAFSKRPIQLAVRVSGDVITVRTSLLPFTKPFVFTKEELSRAGC